MRLYAADGVNTSKVDLGLEFYAGAAQGPAPPDFVEPPLTKQFLRQLNLDSQS